MSGVVVGSRLDQLRALKRRVEVQIELEARQVARGLGSAGRVVEATAPVLPRPEPSPQSPDQVIVPVSSVRTDVVRDWATANGIPLSSSYGPIPRAVVAAFTEAHR